MTNFRTNYNETYPFSDQGVKIWLQANTEITWTVPGDLDNIYRARFAFSSTAEVWVKKNGTIVVPVSGTAVDTYNEEFRPEALYVQGGDVLHFISTGTPQVGVSLLQVPN